MIKEIPKREKNMEIANKSFSISMINIKFGLDSWENNLRRVLCLFILIWVNNFDILSAQETIESKLPAFRKAHKIGFTANYSISNRLPFTRIGNGDEFADRMIGNRFSGNDISLFYNPFDNQTLGFRIQHNKENSYSTSYDYGTISLGFYNQEVEYYRPNVEAFYKFYLFDSYFYLSPLIGISSPKKITSILERASPFIDSTGRDFFVPYGLQTNVSSRVYGGIDFGYSFSFFDIFYLNIGYMVKSGLNPRLRSNYYLGITEISDYYRNFKVENSITSNLILSNLNREFNDVRLGSSNFYVEAGIIF
jgi:hypothetical protein